MAKLSNYMLSKVWNEITYPLANFNGCTVEILKCIYNFAPHIIMDVITYPCWDLSLTMVVKIGSEPVSCIFPTSRVVRSAITGRRHNRKHHRREQCGASVDAQGSYHRQEIEIYTRCLRQISNWQKFKLQYMVNQIINEWLHNQFTFF